MCKPITEEPTEAPTESPTFDPTKKPTPYPTKYPTSHPTDEPTPRPTRFPTNEPTTRNPTLEPTVEPTLSPTEKIVDNSANFLQPDVEEKEETPEQEEEEEEETPKQEEEEEDEDEEEEEEEEKPEETPEEEKEGTPDKSDALVIEIRPCNDPLAMTVNQAYWRSWSSDRPETCNRFEASDIDATTYTHLVYSFASISADGHLEPWVGSWDEVDKYKEFNKVKKRSPDVKTLIAVTEGVFYGAGMNPVTFTEVAESVTTRKAFAQSVVSFLQLYEFDGLDIDWESPLDRDKGGNPFNYERFVLLVEEIRAAIDKSGKDFLLTVALPATEWELYDYDVTGLSEHVDWFNLMSFDYHTPKNRPKTVGAHSDLKLIDSVVFDLLKDTASTKFVLGLAAYGRTYTLADDRCKELGCPFRSPGLGGCGKTPGFLPFNEIHEYILSKSYDELHQDASSSSMVAVVDEDQMISFDDESTWAIKEAYAQMMCLRGTMLWSIDMLKPNFPVLPRRALTGGDPRLLTSSESSCALCHDSKVHADATIEYNGQVMSCSDLHTILTSSFIPLLSDQCHDILSEFRGECCINDSSKTCDICGPGMDLALVKNRRVSYAGSDSACGDLSTSFHLLTKESSFSCSVARTSLTSMCCEESCQMMCPNSGELQADAKVDHGGKQVSCGDYDLILKTSDILKGSDECDSSASRFSDLCCLADATNEEGLLLDNTSSLKPCNVCERGNVHHELKSESMVQYKGTSISCLDLNSILAKSENERSDLCIATQSALFDGCCYEKCSLCGDKSLRWDTTVKYNNQILSCDELGSMFTLATVRANSDQCDAMQGAYASNCCFKPPKKKCNLCSRGSMPYEVNTHSFVKTWSSSMHCINFVNDLAEREEAGSEVCEGSKSDHFTTCCEASSLPMDGTADATYYDWLANHMVPSSANVPCFFFSVWTLIMAFLLFTFHD